MQRPLSSNKTRSNKSYMASEAWYIVTTVVLSSVLVMILRDFTKLYADAASSPRVGQSQEYTLGISRISCELF